MSTASTAIPVTTTNVDSTMRTESEFLVQAKLAQAALQQFVAVKDFDNADETKRSALNRLMKTTVRSFSLFYDFYWVSYFTSSHLTVSPRLSTILSSLRYLLPSTKSSMTFISSIPHFRFRTTSPDSTVFVTALTITWNPPVPREVSFPFFLLLDFSNTFSIDSCCCCSQSSSFEE